MSGSPASSPRADLVAEPDAADTGSVINNLMEERRWLEAAALLRPAVEADPRNAELLADLGKALFKGGLHDEAVPILGTALALNPADLKTLRRLRVISEIKDGQQPSTKKTGAPIRNDISEVLRLARDFGFEPNTIFDIGVCMGTPGLYDDFPEALYVLIDPVEESRPFLEHIAAGLKRCRYAVAAAGAEPGTAMLSFPGYPSGSRMVESVGVYKEGELRPVPVVTIDDLVAEHGASGPFLIKIDTEGSELDVLRGAANTLRDTEMIILESRLRPIGKAPQVYEIVAFLYQRGFVLYDIITFNYHDVDRTLKQVDLVAVREEGFFRQKDRYRSFVEPTPATGPEGGNDKMVKFQVALSELKRTP